MADIVPIAPRTAASAIQTLEEALERARAGEVVAVAIAEVYRDGRLGSGWSDAERMGMLVGAISRLAHAYHRIHDA